MEAMAIEQIVLRLWELEGFWGRTRVRVPPRNGGNWPELDIVGVRARNDGKLDVRLGETKVRQSADFVFVMDDSVATLGPEEWLGTWEKFCGTAADVYWSDIPRLAGLPNWDQIDTLQLTLVFNGWEPENARARTLLETRLKKALTEAWGYTNRLRWMDVIQCKVETTLDVLTSTIRLLRREIESGRGARFGDPFLDGVRELLRYLNPTPSWQPTVRGVKVENPRETIRHDALQCLLAALGVDGAIGERLLAPRDA